VAVAKVGLRVGWYGTQKRRRPYVAHLSKSAFGDLKRKHKGAALERAIAEWIAEHDR